MHIALAWLYFVEHMRHILYSFLPRDTFTDWIEFEMQDVVGAFGPAKLWQTMDLAAILIVEYQVYSVVYHFSSQRGSISAVVVFLRYVLYKRHYCKYIYIYIYIYTYM